MEQENREWEVSEEKSYYQGEIKNSGWRVGRIHGLESDFVAWCATKENADRILDDHRLAAVARDLLGDWLNRYIGWKGPFPNSYCTHCCYTPCAGEGQCLAFDTWAALTEGDQAAGEPQKGNQG